MSLTKKLLLVIIPALILIIALLGVLLFLPENGGSIYVQQITQARKSVESGDYQTAIVYFQNAIKEDSTQVEPYLELANVYFQLNMREEGLKILREGFQTTNSIKIGEALTRYGNGDSNGAENLNKLVSVDTVTVNTTYMDAFAAYNYEKYTKDCTVKNENTNGNVYTVVYEQYDAVFEYESTADNPVLDASTGKPFAYARPTAIRVNTLSHLITGVNEGITIDNLKECGAVNIKVMPYDKSLDTCIVTFEFHGVSVALGSDENGNVKGDNAYNKIVPKRGQAVAAKVTSAGRVINATSGDDVRSAALAFHRGKDNPDGEVAVKTEISGGKYSVELEPGEYTVEITADGYNKEYYDLYVSDSSSEQEFIITISPTLASNEIRFVLEWGATPVDLDSHLVGECKTDGTHSVDVNWMRKEATYGSKTIAELDLDNITGFGPETTTLYDTNGTYEFKVHRYSYDGSLAMSGATVKIYTASSSTPVVVKVPADADDEWWTVCRVVNGEIKDINGITG